jgi:cystathionine gamma-synthase
LLFTNRESAEQCKEFALAEHRGGAKLMPEEVQIRTFKSCVFLYAVLFPASKRSSIQPFWTHTGTGISSRLAEACLEYTFPIREVQGQIYSVIEECEAHDLVRERIAALLNRSPAPNTCAIKISADDVYLFPTGMTAIYTLHTCILGKHNAQTVLFGFAFRSTCFLFDNFGPGCILLGLGTTEELQELKALLEDGTRHKVQAVWTEIPANPMLITADLKALRSLADKHDFTLIVDDTVGSFCNVDVLSVADVLVTSLTKSFSGYADVMGGSIVLNKSSKKYSEFKAMFKGSYRGDYFRDDVKVLERNSRDYIAHSKSLNANAKSLVDFLDSYATNPTSTLHKIYYPTLNHDRDNYEAFMREAPRRSSRDMDVSSASSLKRQVRRLLSMTTCKLTTVLISEHISH